MLWLERFSLFGLSIKCKWDGFLDHTILHVCILEEVFAVRFLLLTQGSATGRRKWWSEKHCHTAEIPDREIGWGNKTPESLSNFTTVYVRANSYSPWPSFLNFPSLNKNINGIGTLVTFRGRNVLRHEAVYDQLCVIGSYCEAEGVSCSCQPVLKFSVCSRRGSACPIGWRTRVCDWRMRWICTRGWWTSCGRTGWNSTRRGKPHRR